MEAHDDSTPLDGWLIGQLRDQPAPSRLGELLLDEGTAAARIEALEALVLELQAQLPPRPHEVPRGHVLFAPTPQGYAVVEVDGPPPRPDEPVLLEGRRYRVERVARSPLPGDRRPCAVLAAE